MFLEVFSAYPQKGHLEPPCARSPLPGFNYTMARCAIVSRGGPTGGNCPFYCHSSLLCPLCTIPMRYKSSHGLFFWFLVVKWRKNLALIIWGGGLLPKSLAWGQTTPPLLKEVRIKGSTASNALFLLYSHCPFAQLNLCVFRTCGYKSWSHLASYLWSQLKLVSFPSLPFQDRPLGLCEVSGDCRLCPDRRYSYYRCGGQVRKVLN